MRYLEIITPAVHATFWHITPGFTQTTIGLDYLGLGNPGGD